MEDANSRKESITFWADDYQRFKEELNFWESDLKKGNFLKLRLKKPDPPFRNYTFDAPLKHNRKREIPEDKTKDHRMEVMARC